MTWSELVDRTVLQFGTNPHNKAIARKFLEEAEKDLAYYTKCYIKDQSIIINPLDNTMDLPQDFLEFKSAVQFNDVILETFRQQVNRLDNNGKPFKGTPRYYLVAGGDLMLIPHPNEDGVVNFQYLAQPQSAGTGDYYKINYKDLDNGFFQKGTQVKGATSYATGIVYNDENDLTSGVLTLTDITEGVCTLTVTSTMVYPNTTLYMSGSVSQYGMIPQSGSLVLEYQGQSQTVNYTGMSVSGTQLAFTGITGNGGNIESGSTADITSSFKQNEVLQTIDDAYNLRATTQTLGEINANWDEYGLSARATASSDIFLWGDQSRDKPQIPSPYHIYLVDYAKSCVAENEKEFDLADRFMKRYEQNRELVRQQVSGKGTGSGQMVVADIIIKNEPF